MKNKRKARSDGRFSAQVVVGYEAGQKKRATIYGDSERDLENKLLDLKGEIKKGIYTFDKILMKDWAEEWLKLYKSIKESNTFAMYSSMVRSHIIPSIGHIKLIDLKTHHLQELVNTFVLKDQNRAAEICAMTLRQILKQAVLNEYAYRNVADGISLPRKRKQEKRALTRQERKLITGCTTFTDIEKAYVYLLYYSGLRRCEALALAKNNIDFENGVIRVRQNIVFSHNKPETRNYLKTDKGQRDVPLMSELRTVLDDAYKTSITPFIMTESEFRCMWNSIRAKLNTHAGGTSEINVIQDDITPHIFRHNFATMMYEAGIDLKEAQRIMGHSDIKVLLQIYTHGDDMKKSFSAQKLTDFISNNL